MDPIDIFVKITMLYIKHEVFNISAIIILLNGAFIGYLAAFIRLSSINDKQNNILYLSQQDRANFWFDKYQGMLKYRPDDYDYFAENKII